MSECSATRKLWASGKLASENHFKAGVSGCPKTLPPGWPQIADSTGTKLVDIAAHKELNLLKIEPRSGFGVFIERFGAPSKPYTFEDRLPSYLSPVLIGAGNGF